VRLIFILMKSMRRKRLSTGLTFVSSCALSLTFFIRYEPEQRLNEEYHRVLMTQVLPHHPSSASKIGCGVDFFKVNLKPQNKRERRELETRPITNILTG
jgi:hypothetical protein